MRAHPQGFSLLEVLAALAIFSGGMIAVIGLLAPVTRTAAAAADAEAAAHVAEAVRSRLLAMPYPTALALIQDPADVRRRDAAPRMDPNHAAGDIPPILGMPDGEVVIRGPSQESAGWSDSLNRVGAGGGTFFEVDLIRNVALSPVARDGLAPYVAFTMRVRWPAFRFSPDGPMGVDPGEMDVLFLGGAILR